MLIPFCTASPPGVLRVWELHLSVQRPGAAVLLLPELLGGCPRAAQGPGRSLARLLFHSAEDESQRSANHKVEMLPLLESKFISPC